jgi:parallel beta-helix repeat protein
MQPKLPRFCQYFSRLIVSTEFTTSACLTATLLLVTSNTVALSNPSNLPIAAEAIAQVPASASVIYVNPTSGTDNPGAGTSEATPVRTITFAIKQAQAGTVIQLAPGTYNVENGEVFPLKLPKNVSLRGNESNKGQEIAIVGGDTYMSQYEGNQSVAVYAAINSTVSGVSIINPKTRGSALWIENNNVTARNNTFPNSSRDGVFITGTANPIVENNLFLKNKGNGISIGRKAGGEIKGNTFDNTGFAISASDTASPRITDNQIRQNIDGIVLSGATAPILRNNLIENNQRDGVVALSSSAPDLGTKDSPGGNKIQNNGRFNLNNATKKNTVLAYGNQFLPGKVAGLLDPMPSLFADTEGHWAEAQINALASKKIISGFTGGSFRPNEPVTRAQFAAILDKAFTPASIKKASSFKDVKAKYWANASIKKVTAGGFMSGYDGQLFKPEEKIPKVQVLVSLVSGLKLGDTGEEVLSVYSDRQSIPKYATSAVATATQKLLVVNYPTTNELNPNRPATRAEVAVFIYQALTSMGKVNPIASPYVVKTNQAALP